MSSEPTPTPRRSWFSRIVRGLPLFVIAVIVSLVCVVRWTTADGDPYMANSALIMGIMLADLVLFGWLFIARLPRKGFLLGLVIVLGPPLAIASYFRVEDMRVTGGIWPILRPRFGADPEDNLEKHLDARANRPVPDAVDLSRIGPTDWPAYRGRLRDGIVLGPALPRDWSAKPPRLLWKHPIGGGHSAFAVVDKALFTLEQRRKLEAVACYDADTGLQHWAYTYPAFFDERMGDKGPRSTPTVTGGEVFALGATGMLTCLDARTGQLKWGPVDTLAGNSNVTWGLAGSPLVVDDLVLVNAGVQTSGAPLGTVVALDRKNGQVLWSTSSRAHAGYSSPLVATLGGKRQLLLFDGDGLAGYEMDDPDNKGRELWRYPWTTQEHINVAQPLILEGDRIFISSGYGVGCAMLQLTQQDGTWNVERLWKSTKMQCKFSSPVLYQGYIYGLDNQYLACMDAATGKRYHRGERYNFGQVLLCQDLLLVSGEDGELALVEASPESLRELGRIQALQGRSWNPAAVAGGRVYWRNNVEMVCFDLSGH